MGLYQNLTHHYPIIIPYPIPTFERERAFSAPLSPSEFTTGRTAMSTIQATMKTATRPRTAKRAYLVDFGEGVRRG